MYYTFRSCSSKLHRKAVGNKTNCFFSPVCLPLFFILLLLLNLSVQFSRILELNLDARWRLHWVWGFQFVAFINWRGDATLKRTLSNSREYLRRAALCSKHLVVVCRGDRWKVDSNEHTCACDHMQTRTNPTPSVFINRWTASLCKWWNNEKRREFFSCWEGVQLSLAAI